MHTQQNTYSAQQFSFILIYAVLQQISVIIYGNLKVVHTKLQAEYTDQNMTVTCKCQNYVYKKKLIFTYKHNFII